MQANVRGGGIHHYAIGFAVSFIGMLLEAKIIGEADINYNGNIELLTVVIATYCMFNLIVSWRPVNNKKYIVLRNISTLIYLSHCFIIRSVKMVLGVWDRQITTYILFVVVLVLSFLFSVIVIKSSSKRNWLKSIY